jgi:DNA polymerase (family 10)
MRASRPTSTTTAIGIPFMLDVSWTQGTSPGPATLPACTLRGVDRLAVARMLREIGLLLEVQGESRFRARAYERGARALESLADDLGAVVREGRLTAIPGIGSALAATIREIHETGQSAQLERLRAALPPGVLELVDLPGLTLPRIAALHAALGVTGLADLRAACEAGRLRVIKGFGPKLEEKILAGIRDRETRGVALLLHRALEEGERLLAHVRAGTAVIEAELAGDLRRRTETVDRLVVAIATREPAAALDHVARYPPALGLLGRTATGLALGLPGGFRVEAETAPPAGYAALLHALTGSEAHRARLAERAARLGLALDRRGLAPARGRGRLAVATEADLYGHLRLPPIPPELREDAGEIEAALAGTLPADLVEVADIRGMVHCHTVHSDGAHTVEEMARAALALGMRYITITDHSPTASYAGGLTLDRLRRQWDEIAEVQARLPGIAILRGTESDILRDGALDYPDAVLAQLDVIVASLHNRYRMDEEAMTRRLVAAMRHPLFKIWGHALGRYVLRRPPLACRMEEVLDAAAASRVAIEVNANPHRLDMEPRWQREARRRGLRFVVSTDAHSTAELGNLPFGIAMARRGGLRRGDVLNSLDADAFRRAVRPA